MTLEDKRQALEAIQKAMADLRKAIDNYEQASQDRLLELRKEGRLTMSEMANASRQAHIKKTLAQRPLDELSLVLELYT